MNRHHSHRWKHPFFHAYHEAHRMHRNRWKGRRRGPRGRFFGPGEVRLALLSLLAEGPQHGYALMRELEARSDGAYRASAGTIYPTLAQLEDEGLARVESGDGKRVFHLTDAGRETVESERETIERIWRRAERLSDWSWTDDPDASEIVRPIVRLARAAYRAMYRDPEQIDEIRARLESAREAIENLSPRSDRRD